MKQRIAFALLLLVTTACNKDKFQSKPRLVLKSEIPAAIPIGGNLELVFEYTDKEGDVSDTLYFKKDRLNKRKVDTKVDSVVWVIPNFPKAQQGEIIVNLDYENYLKSAINPPRENPGQVPELYESDTLNLKFLLKDKAGNKSDTVRIDNLVVLRSF